MIFEYNMQKVFTQSIDVKDIGNAFLRCISEDGVEYYLASRTLMGKTSILIFGPVIPDVPIILNNFFMSYKKIDYKEKTIIKEFTQVMNDPHKKISKIEAVSIDDVQTAIPSFNSFFLDENDAMMAAEYI